MQSRVNKEDIIFTYSFLGIKYVTKNTVEEAYWYHNSPFKGECSVISYIDTINADFKTDIVKIVDREDFIKDKVIILEVKQDLFNIDEETILPVNIIEAIYNTEEDEVFNYEYRRDVALYANDLDLDELYIEYGICKTLQENKFYLKDLYNELDRVYK